MFLKTVCLLLCAAILAVLPGGYFWSQKSRLLSVGMGRKIINQCDVRRFEMPAKI